MMNGHDLTSNKQFVLDVGNIKSGELHLGNGKHALAVMLASFRGATHRYPYSLNLPYLTMGDARAHDPLTYVFPDVNQYIDPTKRQAQNLDRTPKAVVSYPVMLLIAGAVLFLAVFTITLNASASASITR